MKLSARNILENRSPYNAGEANSYPRGFLAVNCNGVIIVSLGKNSLFMVLLKPRIDKKKTVGSSQGSSQTKRNSKIDLGIHLWGGGH